MRPGWMCNTSPVNPSRNLLKVAKFQLGALRACNGELMFYPQIILQSPFSWGVEPLDFSYINLCLLGTLDIRCSFISFISHLAWVYMPLSQFFARKNSDISTQNLAEEMLRWLEYFDALDAKVAPKETVDPALAVLVGFSVWFFCLCFFFHNVLKQCHKPSPSHHHFYR